MSRLFVILCVLTLFLSGCAGKPRAAPAEDPSATTTASQRASFLRERPLHEEPSAPGHVEYLQRSGSVFVGSRGYTYLCGGLTEFGAGKHDTADITWELPPRTVNDTESKITMFRVSVVPSGPTQLEAYLYLPQGGNLGRAYAASIGGGTNVSLDRGGRFDPGEYKLVVRVCGPDNRYTVHAAAEYEL